MTFVHIQMSPVGNQYDPIQNKSQWNVALALIKQKYIFTAMYGLPVVSLLEILRCQEQINP
jgi:hypothetical protein